MSSALYTYKVDGVLHEGHRISPWVFVTNKNARFILEKQMSKVKRTSDGSVMVHHHPTKPHASYLIPAGPLGMAITAGLGLLPLLLYILEHGL